MVCPLYTSSFIAEPIDEEREEKRFGREDNASFVSLIIPSQTVYGCLRRVVDITAPARVCCVGA